jgi:S1-C subfamily serine protease
MRRIAAIVVGLLSLDLTAQSGQAREPTPVWSGAPRHGKGTAGLAELAERARAAVVHVRGEMPDGSAAGESDSEGGRTSIGTGFIINKDGYLLTNEHVVRGVIDLRVRLLDGRELGACVVGADMATDLALLKVTTKRPLPVLALGDSASVRVGEPVIAIGNPYGFNHSVTAGIVSAKERVVDRASLHEPGAEDLYSFFIQTDASINLGNSGGPLIDASGAVIGVNAAFWAGHPLQPAQGIGFAIPINMAKALLPRLMQTGTARRGAGRSSPASRKDPLPRPPGWNRATWWSTGTAPMSPPARTSRLTPSSARRGRGSGSRSSATASGAIGRSSRGRRRPGRSPRRIRPAAREPPSR